MSMNRREFLRRVAFGAAGASLVATGARSVNASEAPPENSGPIDLETILADENIIFRLIEFSPALAAVRVKAPTPDEYQSLCTHLEEVDDGYDSHVRELGGPEAVLKILSYLSGGSLTFKVYQEAARTVVTFVFKGTAMIMIWGTGTPTMFPTNREKLNYLTKGIKPVNSPAEIDKTRGMIGGFKEAYQQYCQKSAVPAPAFADKPVEEKQIEQFVFPTLLAGAGLAGLVGALILRARGRSASRPSFVGAGD